MGTRCNIAIVLEKEDLDKDIQFNWKNRDLESPPARKGRHASL